MRYSSQFAGHFGSAFYFLYIGIVSFLEASDLKGLTPKHFIILHFIGSCLFGPLAILAEISISHHNLSMENLHHYSMYSLAVMDALLVLICDLNKVLPKKWRIAYESFLFVCLGILFTAHNHGNYLYNGFHQLMLPMFVLVAIMHYVCELDSSQQSLKMLRCLMLSILSTWFFNIAFGFFAYIDCGYLGCQHDIVDQHEAYGNISYIFSLHFMGWVVFYTILLTIFTKLDIRNEEVDSEVYKQVNVDEDDYNIQLSNVKSKTYV